MEKKEADAVFQKEERNIPLEELAEEFAKYRLSDPKTEQEVKMSLGREGQLSPIVVCRVGSVYQVLDGFKRLRACQTLPHVHELKARIIGGGEGRGRAAMLRLNQERKGLCMVEEALIVHGMHHEEGLRQTVIAQLVNHHPSWVCRRIAMIERLDTEVVDHMKWGLIVGAMGRHIEKLPRGNQVDLLEVIETDRLSCRETADLVSHLTNRQDFTKKAMEKQARYLVGKRNTPEAESKPGTGRGGGGLQQLLARLQRICQEILAWSESHDPAEPLGRPSTMTYAGSAHDAAERVLALLRKHGAV